MANSLHTNEHNKLLNFIWSAADDCLRGHYARSQYRDVIIPMTLIARFDAVLVQNQAIIDETKEFALQYDIEFNKLVESSLRKNGIYFSNSSKYRLQDLKSKTDPDELKQAFKTYLKGFSENIKEILGCFDFNKQIDKMNEIEILGTVIEKFTNPEMSLSPSVFDKDGKIVKKGLDNHAMGTLFEELIRKFNEENNEEAGEHFTPRDVVELMTDIAISSDYIAKHPDRVYSIYDGACGTLGMCTVAEEHLQKIAKKQGKKFRINIYGQEVNSETYAIAKADLLLKGGKEHANKVSFGSTITHDGFAGKKFDLMLSNPPYGKNWKNDLEELSKNTGGTDKDPKKNVNDSRFVIPSYKDEGELRMVPDVSDGQLLFLLNNIAKMKDPVNGGSRIVEVHSGSALSSGDAGSGFSNIRRYVIENDLLEAIILLPANMFYNTGIATNIWVLSNNKEERRRGKVQLIDATNLKKDLPKNMGKKRCEFTPEIREQILDTYNKFEDSNICKVFTNDDLGYWKVTVERPLRQAVACTKENLDEIKTELQRVTNSDGSLNKEKLGSSFIKASASAMKELEKTENLSAYLEVLEQMLQKELYLDYAKFEKAFNQNLKTNEKAKEIKGLSLAKLVGTGLLTNMIVRDENAEPQKDSKGNLVADAELRDVEKIPMSNPGGIQGFIEHEVLPDKPDAFIDDSKTIIGYELNMSKYFMLEEQGESIKSIFTKIRELDRREYELLNDLAAELE